MAKTIKQIAALFCIELIILLPVYFASGLTVSNVGISGITGSSAAISWATDEDSDSKVYYGKTSLLGYEEANDTLALSHILAITNLTGGTLYYYIAASCNANNNCTNSTMESFATIDSEQAIIRFFVEYEMEDKIPPAGVTGLINGTIRPNSVMFSWDENNDTDFDKYIIYRSDIGAIATTSSKSYTSYTDVLVNSNTTYSYQV